MEPPSPVAVYFSPPAQIDSAVETQIADAVIATLHRFGQPTPSRHVEVEIGSNDWIQGLNLSFRGIDEPTDVLSFPAPESSEMPLGEIAISIEVAAHQAAFRNISLEHELCLLAIHGTLHLLGFDDIEEQDRHEMMKAMSQVAADCHIEIGDNWTSRDLPQLEATR